MTFAQNNSAIQTQTGNDNDAIVDQAGNDNESIIDQTSSFGTGQYAEVDQNGSENESDILQDRANAEAYIHQLGSQNQSASKQSGYNILDVYQEGNNNILSGYGTRARAYQKNGSGIFTSDMNEIDLYQLGNGNEAGVWQEHHAEATISQIGEGNNTQIFQSGPAFGDLNQSTRPSLEMTTKLISTNEEMATDLWLSLVYTAEPTAT